MTAHFAQTAYDSAWALHDGGWNSDDREELSEEFALEKDEADMLCAYLEQIEEEEGILC